MRPTRAASTGTVLSRSGALPSKDVAAAVDLHAGAEPAPGKERGHAWHTGPKGSSAMRRMPLLLLLFGIVFSVWCPTSFAQRQTAVGPGIIALSPTGVLNGVDMSGSGTTGTLTVGVLGGPEMDIFTSNTSLAHFPLAVSTAASSQGNILFNSSSTVYGDIGVTQPGGPFLLDISGGNAGTTVNFLGPVFATTTTVSGTGTLNFNSGSTNITATNCAGDGTISLAPNTTLIGALTTTAGAQTGTLVLGGGSVLNGAVGGAIGLRAINVVGGSNTAGVSATITGAADAYSFSLGTNTLNVGGALTIANLGPGGVINTTLASPTVYGNIRPVGATNLGSTLQVRVTVPTTSFIPVGTQFNIVQTQTGTVQSGTNGSVVVVVTDPNNPLYTFSAVPPAGTVAGLVAIKTTGEPILVPVAPPPGVPLPAVLPIAAAVVPPLLAVAPVVAPSADLLTVVAAANALSNPAAVVLALAQLAPSAPDLAAPLVSFEGTRQFQDLWSSHLDNLLCGLLARPGTEPANCQGNNPHGTVWMKGFGYFGNQGTQGAYPGYSSEIFGTMIAYDMPLDSLGFGGETHAGLGIGYARSTITGKTFSASTDANTYQVTAYIGHEVGPWYVKGDVSSGSNDYSGTRNTVFPGIDRSAQASYSGQDYTGYVTTGYHFFARGVTITPLASLQYTHMNLDGYTESGAGDINLHVNSQSYDFLESGLGVKVARAFHYRDRLYVPEAHFKWFHELNNPTMQNTAAFVAPGSPAFTTPGLTPAADTLDLGTSFSFLSCACNARTWSVKAVYDYYWTDAQYFAQRAMIQFSMRF